MSRVRQELTQLKGSQEQLLAERDQAQAQLAAAQEEVVALTKCLEEAQEKVSQTGSVRPPAASEKSARSPTRTKGRSRRAACRVTWNERVSAERTRLVGQ